MSRLLLIELNDLANFSGFWWLLLLLGPLLFFQHRLQFEVQGIFLLITRRQDLAITLFSVLFFPGVVLHESSQLLLAQLLRVKVKKFSLWPQTRRGKLIRLGLVEIDKETDMVRETLIGVIPLLTGICVIGLLAGWRFDLDTLSSSFATGDLPTIATGLGDFMSVPDFWLWVYLVFAIGNAMLPEPHDEINWWLIGGVVGGIAIFLLVLDLGIVLQAGLEGPLAQLGKWTGLALVMTLTIDLFGMVLISVMEFLFSRLLGRELEYQ